MSKHSPSKVKKHSSKRDKKVKRSISVYPFYLGTSCDLIGWVIIGTLFMTTVKGLNASQISSLVTIGCLFSLVAYPIIMQFVDKFGNVAAARCGTLMMLSAMLCMTFAPGFEVVAVGSILYELGMLTKTVESVVLKRDLIHQKKNDQFIEVTNKATLVYSLITFAIAASSGFLFNMNHYLPCIIGIVLAATSFILSLFLYEPRDIDGNETITGEDVKRHFRLHNLMSGVSKRKSYRNIGGNERVIPMRAFRETATNALSAIRPRVPKLFKKLPKIAIFIIIFFGVTLAAITLGQNNTTLALQYHLEEFVSPEEVAIFLTIFIAIARGSRIIGNAMYIKFCDKLGDKVTFAGLGTLGMGLILVITGDVFAYGWVGAILIEIGLCTCFIVRDPLTNYLDTLLLNNVKTEQQEKSIVMLTVCRKIAMLLISGAVTMMLLQVHISFAIAFIAVIVGASLVIANSIYQLIEPEKDDVDDDSEDDETYNDRASITSAFEPIKLDQSER